MNLKHAAIYQYIFLSSLLLLSACSSKPQDGVGNSQPNEQIVSVIPPFQTKEPQHYQAVRIISFTDPSGTSTTRRTTIARSELLRREETETNDSGAIVFLELDNGRFVLLPGTKVYSQITESSGIDPTEFESSPERLLHPVAVSTTYQKLGTELVAGRKTTKYKATVNTPTASNVTANETLIWVDESLGMPIRSEATTSDGGRLVMELSNIRLEVDKNLFRIPEDYRKVTATELRQRLSHKLTH